MARIYWPRRRTLRLALAVASVPGALLGIVMARAADPDVAIGERPTIEVHLDQSRIESGDVTFKECLRRGRILFESAFNTLDGQGRPLSRGNGVPRAAGQPAFIRTSGPDSNSCLGCHNQPRSGGGGDFVANVFVLAQTLDPVTSSVDGTFSNERNTLGMAGAGPIEMLAREMTAELLAIREDARRQAQTTGVPVKRTLSAKGIGFGSITVLADGRVDPTAIEGVDWDLIVKPFHQKGAVVSLREFSNNAMNHHHGMQSVERFGLDTDPDGDGVTNELTVGDITAVTLFQAALNTPGRLLPASPARRAAAERGEQIFSAIHCSQCHVPALILNRPVFTEPNPYNPTSPDHNLQVSQVRRLVSFDLTREGPAPRLQRRRDGTARVRAFTDLKRHDLNDADYDHFANEQLPQGLLTGTSPASAFTVPPVPRPTRQFLTRKLWDAGNSAPYGHRGDLTTLTEAINFHGGEARATRDAFFSLSTGDQAAVIEFLKTLQILPDGSAPVVVEGEGPDDYRDDR
jgi:cytochrome c peroxidase